MIYRIFGRQGEQKEINRRGRREHGEEKGEMLLPLFSLCSLRPLRFKK
jgi:hypothetical protein